MWVAAAMLWTVYLVTHEMDQRTTSRLMAQQTQLADLWARTITTRLESMQRVLTSMAQGWEAPTLLDTESMAALMQQEGSVLQIFDSVHAVFPQAQMSQYSAAGSRMALDARGQDALRRTMEDGKPSLTYMQPADESAYLFVVMAVPLHHSDYKVAGALAAVLRLPVAGLIPHAEQDDQAMQYLLIGEGGLILAHSDSVQRWRNISEVWDAYTTDWPRLSEPSVAHADTRVWGHVMATRVGLPLPQWQAVMVRDIAADQLWPAGLSRRAVALLLGGFAALSLLAGVALWGWLAPWPRREKTPLHLDDLDSSQAVSDPAEQTQPMLPIVQQPYAAVWAMFEAAPSAMLLEYDQRIQMATPQVSVMLGIDIHQGEPPAMQQLFDRADTLQLLRQTLMELGSFEGCVCLRKKDGDVIDCEVLAWVPSQLPGATVWRLRLPWRQHRLQHVPVEQHLWRDALTGLPTREAFLWNMQSWITQSLSVQRLSVVQPLAHPPAQGCVLFADLDHLGMLNEVTSREMGNKVLRHVGRLLASYTQALGDVARLGGDEFVVLLPGVSLAHAQGIAQSLCDAVWRWQPLWNGERYWVSISVGVVAVDATRHQPEEALRAADLACYEAKRRGRAQTAVGQISAVPA